MTLYTIDYRVKGKVQGVFFRVFVKDLAQELRIVGWVKNDPVSLFATIFGQVRIQWLEAYRVAVIRRAEMLLAQHKASPKPSNNCG